jgi:hypothetical protein
VFLFSRYRLADVMDGSANRDAASVMDPSLSVTCRYSTRGSQRCQRNQMNYYSQRHLLFEAMNKAIAEINGETHYQVELVVNSTLGEPEHHLANAKRAVNEKHHQITTPIQVFRRSINFYPQRAFSGQ